MKVIRPNCRTQFTPADYQFLESVLPNAKGINKANTLYSLFHDGESFDLLLDNPKVFRALIDLRGCLSVSMHFYFYVLVRHELMLADITQREVADYVAEVLAEFAMLSRLIHTQDEQSGPLEYLCDMIIALERLEERNRFALQSHIGNYSLFLSGLFPNRLTQRMHRKGAPNIKFYEDLGRSHFRMAGHQPMAKTLDLVSVYSILDEAFHITRIALNHLSEKMIFLESNQAVNNLLLEFERPNLGSNTL